MAVPVGNWVLSPHAARELARRGIAVETVARILAAPEQRLTVRGGRDVLQSIMAMDGRSYLIRVFVDIDRSPAEVVTAYRTSKINKYWSLCA